ncbi:neuropeptide FF receptor 1-like [Montipora capricornis]|uniref:neuropeptide FF receptor 1-like n=1 Tax=Montipora capricornis TaxID=246305 RepID=UPI0035F19C4E
MFDSIDITIATVECLIAVTSIAGNLLVCFVIVKNRDMRTPFNYLLVNLAVADIIYPTFLLIYDTYNHSLHTPDEMPGNAICLSLRKLAWIGADSSVFTLIAIARERYFTVVHPHSIQRKLTWQKLKVIIPGTWILSALFNIRGFVMQSFDRKVAVKSCTHLWLDAKELQKAYRLTMVIFVSISSLLIIGYYSFVVYTLWCKRDDQKEKPFHQQGVLKVRKRVTLMVLTVTTLFEICWISDTVIHVLKDFGLCPISGIAFPITHTTIAFNSAVNPFAYALINQGFREKMKGMLCNGSCAIERNVNADHQGTAFQQTATSTCTHSREELGLTEMRPTREIRQI